MRHFHLLRLVVLSGVLFVGLVSIAQAQTLIYLGVHGAPSLQTIRIQEATITEGYRISLMPQAGLRIRYQVDPSFSLRLDGRFFEKGASLFLEPDSVVIEPSGLATLKAQYIGFGMGGEYRTWIRNETSVGGSLDFVYGRLRETSLRIRDGNGTVSFADFFFPSYAGLDLGLFLETHCFQRFWVRLAPTFEVQLNHAYQSDLFQTKFVGFAPRLEIYIPLIRKKRNKDAYVPQV